MRMQAIQYPIRDRRRDNSTLRYTHLSWEPLPIFDVPCLQPFPEHLFVRRNASNDPVKRNVVETGLNIALSNPLRSTFSRKRNEALLDRVGSASFPAKPIRVWVCTRFRYRLQGEQMQCLHRPVGLMSTQN